MAVTFVVEDGTGKSDATSYISDTDADQIVEDYGLEWAAGEDAESKRQKLNAATQYCDSKYNPFQSERTVYNQALYFPRVEVEVDGVFIDSDVIHINLKRAVVEVAVYMSNNDNAFPDLDDGGALKMERIKIDVLEIEEEYAGTNAGSEVSSKVDALMAPFQEAGGGANIPVSRG